MKPRAGQNQNRSPCPRALRAPARPHVRLSDTPRTGRAAEDVGPYHPSCPDAARRAKDPRRPRRGTSERARRATSPGGEGRNSLRPGQEGILPVNTERAETRRHGGG